MVAQLVAVTVDPDDTVEIADCPHPESPDPVLQILLILGDPVLTKVL